MSGESVLDIIEGYLDREGQVYERNVYGNVDGIHIEFDIGCKLGTITESLMVYDDTLIILAQCLPMVEEKQRIRAATLLTKLNFTSYLGYFQLNLDTGNVMYRISHSLGDGELTEKVLNKSIIMPFVMFKRQEEALESIINGAAKKDKANCSE